MDDDTPRHNDHPGSQRCASQIIEPVKTGAVIEVRNKAKTRLPKA